MNDYYTVSQYAEIYGKDPGNIRRMLIRGAILGEKIGKQWLIPKDAEYPSDKRVKSGNYHNWRQKIAFNSKHPQITNKLSEMCNSISEIYGSSVIEVILYGSYARGEETEESDIDMALILKDEQTNEQYDKLTDIAVDYELDMGVTLSIVPIEQQNYIEWKETLPFYRNVEKEGIILWKSA